MTELEVVKLFKALADKSRLSILKSLAKEPMYVELLAERLKLTPATISFHLKKLQDLNIVNSKKEQYYVVYSLNEEILSVSILDIIKKESSEEDLQLEREENYRKKVIESFFEYGKLKSIPVQNKKEKIVLSEILKAFEKGREYSEREVNIIIADFNDDFCTIRRDMIDFGMLERSNGIYKVTDKS